MKKFLTMLLFAATAASVFASVVRNADWSQKTGNSIIDWTAKPNSSFVSVSDGVLTLNQGGLVWQSQLKLEVGKTYIFECEVAGEADGKAMFYCDYRNQADQLRSYRGREFAVSGNYQKNGFNFTVPQGSKGYAVILRSNQGKVSFRNLKITEVKTSKLVGAIRNPDWSAVNGAFPVDWSIRPASAEVVSVKDGVLHLKSTDSKQAVLAIQEKLPMRGGSVYRAECRIKSESKSDVMFYIEYRNASGRLVATNAVWRKTIPGWERHTFNVRLPENIQGQPYIVLRPAVGGEAEFKDLSLKELATAKDVPLLGGVMRGIIRQESPIIVSLEDSPAKQVAAAHRNVPITPGKSCVYNFSIRGEGVSGHNTGFHIYRVEVVLGDGSILTFSWDDTWNDRKQFKNLKFIVPDKPENNSMTVNFYANSKGKIVLEDFKVACNEIDPAENYYFVMKSPVCRDTFFGATDTMTCSGEVNAYSAPQADSVQLKDAEGKVVKQSKINWNGKLFANFDLELGKLAYGNYSLQLLQDNKVLISRVIKVIPEGKNMVTYNADKQILFNGKPFFVNLIWWNPPNYGDNLKSLQQIADNGITVSRVTGASTEAVVKCLDNFEKAGIKAMLDVGLTFYQINRRKDPKAVGHVVTPEFIEEFLIDEIKNHPALMGYHLIDEPMWGGVPVEPLLAAYNKLRELDPYHPVWINAAPRGEISGHRIYSGAADWYGLDIYPVPAPNSHSNLDDQNLTSVGKYTRRMVEAVNNRKPVVMTLQAFSWYSYSFRKDKSFKDNGKDYPTTEQLRFMSFDALTCGSAGLAWWGIHYARSKAFVNDYMKVMCEFYELSGILAAGKRSQALEKDGIRYCDYTLDNCKLYVVLNITDKPQTAVLPAFEGGKALDWYSKDNASAGSKVEMSPFAVKVYVTGTMPEAAYKLPVTGGAATEYTKGLQ